MKKTLLFDFDGTIVDSFANFLEITDILSTKYNFQFIAQDELDELRSQDANTLIKRFKIPLYKLPFMARDFKKMQKEQIEHLKPCTGLPEVLHKLKKSGYDMGILTSNGEENVRRFMRQHKMDIFTYIYSDSSMFGKDKVLRKFLKNHALKKEQVLYVGDEIRDIQACKNVGIPIVAVTWGFNSKTGLVKHTPDFLIDEPQELLKVVSSV